MSEVDPTDESIGRWVVSAHRYDDEAKHFRYMPIAAYTTKREFQRRFKLEGAALDKRRSQGKAHPKESITGQWKGEGHPPVAFQVRVIRLIVRKFFWKKQNFTYDRGYSQYEVFTRREELVDDSDLN
jgi:hypothetical protein